MNAISFVCMLKVYTSCFCSLFRVNKLLRSIANVIRPFRKFFFSITLFHSVFKFFFCNRIEKSKSFSVEIRPFLLVAIFIHAEIITSSFLFCLDCDNQLQQFTWSVIATVSRNALWCVDYFSPGWSGHRACVGQLTGISSARIRYTCIFSLHLWYRHGRDGDPVPFNQ